MIILDFKTKNNLFRIIGKLLYLTLLFTRKNVSVRLYLRDNPPSVSFEALAYAKILTFTITYSIKYYNRRI